MKIAAFVLALIAVGAVWYAIDNRGNMNERIDILEAELEAQTAYVTTMEAEYDQERAHADSVIAARDTAIAELEEAVTVKGGEASVASRRLRGTIAALSVSEREKELLRQQVHDMVLPLTQQIELKDEIILNERVKFKALSEVYQASVRLNEALRAKIATQDDLIVELRSAANPDFITKLTRDPLPKVAFGGAFFALGVLASK